MERRTRVSVLVVLVGWEIKRNGVGNGCGRHDMRLSAWEAATSRSWVAQGVQILTCPYRE